MYLNTSLKKFTHTWKFWIQATWKLNTLAMCSHTKETLSNDVTFYQWYTEKEKTSLLTNADARISFQNIHTCMYVWNTTEFLKCIWNTLVNTSRAYAAYKLYHFYFFRIKKKPCNSTKARQQESPYCILEKILCKKPKILSNVHSIKRLQLACSV